MRRFSEEQIDKARSVSILEWLMANEPGNLVQSAKGEYRLKDHKSFIISNGKWNWFNGGMGGYSALDYLVKYKQETFVNAVKILTDENEYDKSMPSQSHAHHSQEAFKKEPPEKPFELPERHANNNRAILYLQSRDISMDTIQRCIDANILYQSAKMPNVVFVGYDGTEAKYAYQRGTISDFKQETKGSRKIHGFCMPPASDDENSKKTVAVFESPLDALAHSTFMEIAKKSDNVIWDGYRLSLGGTTSGALEKFLEKNPQVEKIFLCLDSDDAGRKATKRIIQEIKSNPKHSEKSVTDAPPKYGKDYGDTLKTVKAQHQEILRQSAEQQKQKKPRQPDTR